MSNKKRTKGWKTETTGLYPGVEGYTAWAALPLVLSFLRSSQISRAEDSAWFGSIQSLNPVPSAKCRMQRESRWLGRLKLSAKLMRSKHDGGHTQGFYANACAVLLPRPKRDWMPLAVGPHWSATLSRTVQKGDVRFAFAIERPDKVVSVLFIL